MLAFARALGEFGSLVLISGNIPFKTEVSSVFIRSQIESGNVSGAAAVSVVLLAISLLLLVAVSFFAPPQPRALRGLRMTARRARQVGPSHARLRLPGAAAARPGGDDLLQDLRARPRAADRGDDLARRPARDLADAADGRRRRPPQHDLRGRLRAAARPPQVEGQRGDRRDHQPPLRDLPGGDRPLAVPALRQRRLVRADARRAGESRSSSPPQA